MNIVLIGYRGTGKSAVAKILSTRLRWTNLDMDQEIVKMAGLEISQIVSRYGWGHFRNLENQVAVAAGEQDCTIIDTGGGVVLRSENMEALRGHGVVIWLKASPAVIVGRIKDSSHRPSLTGAKSFLDEVEEVLKERTPQYRKAADLEIETDALTTEAVAEKILALLHEQGRDSI